MPAATQEPIEVAFARLDERFDGFKEAFQELADNQRRLSDSYEKLVQGTQRIGLVEADLQALKKSNDTLWAKFDAHVESQSSFTGNALFEICKLGVAIILGALFAKYGIKLP